MIELRWRTIDLGRRILEYRYQANTNIQASIYDPDFWSDWISTPLVDIDGNPTKNWRNDD